MTPWQVAGVAFGLAAYAVAWVWGGRPERFAAGLLLLSCLLSSVTYKWAVDGFPLFSMGLDSVRLLIFGWLCFRSDRWWPFVITGALALMVFLYFPRLLDSRITQYALVSAHVGLGYLIDLTLMLSVFERRLAGEPPASRAAWAAAVRATAVRRTEWMRPAPVGGGPFDGTGAAGAIPTICWSSLRPRPWPVAQGLAQGDHSAGRGRDFQGPEGHSAEQIAAAIEKA